VGRALLEVTQVKNEKKSIRESSSLSGARSFGSSFKGKNNSGFIIFFVDMILFVNFLQSPKFTKRISVFIYVIIDVLIN
jgi:hypothetical protein